MKKRPQLTIATIVMVLLCPALATAADQTEAPGTWQALIFYVINFALFVWVIKRFAGSLIADFFRNRAAAIRSNVGRAAQAFKEAEELSRRAAEMSAGLPAEKQRILAELTSETEYQLKQIEAMGREGLERIKRDAALGVAAAREAGQRRLRESLAVAAERLARDLVSRDFAAPDQTRLLASFVGRLAEEARN
jgi:F0F1-type ATP synthase membrane subunit b/b'